MWRFCHTPMVYICHINYVSHQIVFQAPILFYICSLQMMYTSSCILASFRWKLTLVLSCTFHIWFCVNLMISFYRITSAHHLFIWWPSLNFPKNTTYWHMSFFCYLVVHFFLFRGYGTESCLERNQTKSLFQLNLFLKAMHFPPCAYVKIQNCKQLWHIISN